MISVKSVWNGRSVKNEVNNKMAIAVQGGGLIMLGNVQTVTPVRTGELVASIQQEFKSSQLVCEVKTDKEYAPFVEFGTAKQMAHPFMRLGFKLSVRNILSFAKRTLSKLFKGV